MSPDGDELISTCTLFHGPIPRYRLYHRPIDSPEHLGCNRSIAADSVGRATLRTGLAAPLACQEENEIAKDIPVRGLIFDVDTGRLREVKVLEHERAA